MAYVARRLQDDPYASPSQALQQGQQASQGQQQTGIERAGSTGVQTAQTGTQGTAQPGKAPGDFTRSNYTNANTILARNRGTDTSAITGRLVGNADQEAGNRVSALDARGRGYVEEAKAGYTQRYAAPDPDALLRALAGDKDADARVRESAMRTGIDKTQFKDVGAQAGELVPQEFFNAGEFTPLLQRRAQGSYTAGMAGLDQALANSQGIGQQVKQTVQGLQSNVQAKTDATNALRGKVETDAEKYWKENQDLLKGSIGTEAAKIKAASAGRVAPTQQSMSLTQTQAAGKQTEALGQRTAGKVKELSALSAQLRGLGLDSSKIDSQIEQLNGRSSEGFQGFLTGTDAPKVSAADLVTQDEAEDFNQLMGYLGSGESLAAGKGAQAGNPKINDAAFNQWLQSVIGNEPASAQAAIAAEKARRALPSDSAREVAAANGLQQAPPPPSRDSSGISATGTPAPKGPTLNPNAGRSKPLAPGEDPLDNTGVTGPVGGPIIDPGTTDAPVRRAEQGPLGSGTPQQGGQKSGTLDLRTDAKNVANFFSGGSGGPSTAGNSSQFGGTNQTAGDSPLAAYSKATDAHNAKRAKDLGALASKPVPNAAEKKKIDAWNKANPAPKAPAGISTKQVNNGIGVGSATKHLCGAMHALGHLPDAIYMADLAYAVTVPMAVKRGYTFWALPLSEIVRHSPVAASLCKPFVLAWANEMAGNSSRLGRFLKRVGEPACALLGRIL